MIKGLSMVNPNQSKPALYRIRVKGLLDDSWSERLGGMAITVEQFSYKKPETVLLGSLRDQAALSGVLNTLYGLNLAVLSIESFELPEV
jgi:hypothetical protein